MTQRLKNIQMKSARYHLGARGLRGTVIHCYQNVGILGLNQFVLVFLEKEGKRRVISSKVLTSR